MMKKLLLLCTLIPALGFGQILEENWDGAGQGIAAWTVIDVDNQTPDEDVAFVTNAWVVVDKDGADGDFGGPAGDHAAASTSWYAPAGTSNDWLISPIINLTEATGAFLKWDAKAQDVDFPDGYEVRLAPNGGTTVADFTVVLYTTEGENTFWTTRGVDMSPYVGQMVRFAFVNNSTDKFILLVDNISVTEEEVEIPLAYCPVVIENGEAITLVNFAGINSVTDPESEDPYIDYTGISGTVTPGENYTITLEGNTAGDFEDFFVVFIDWDQDGTFEEDTERIEAGSIENSTGDDGISTSATITVPADAVAGPTRMRIIKLWDEIADTACFNAGFSFGQAQDYTLQVGTMGTGSFNKAGFAYYPNPVTNVLNVNYTSAIESVTIYNLLGQEVLNQKIGANEGNVNVASLAAGTYVTKVTADNGVTTVKIVKQ